MNDRDGSRADLVPLALASDGRGTPVKVSLIPRERKRRLDLHHDFDPTEAFAELDDVRGTEVCYDTSERVAIPFETEIPDETIVPHGAVTVRHEVWFPEPKSIVAFEVGIPPETPESVREELPDSYEGVPLRYVERPPPDPTPL
ncbi:hypothetical protein [Halorussus halophilus]|uniref:hypothetical protein n=1 Tax=Halorussus halophilus TaxID=2650975 RepID=UPI0013010F92|nr:hypothetical protein [Halorussus halophilus]